LAILATPSGAQPPHADGQSRAAEPARPQPELSRDHVGDLAAGAAAKPVLVIGERGTGKELIAARLHYLSPRWNQPFVKLNCAALSRKLLEAELFGHEAGAFTGAQRRRLGRFELAHRGTLFLDEIANAPLTVQETILRVVEYGSSSGSAAARRCGSMSAWSRRPMSICRRWPRPASSAPICSTGWPSTS
jgi:transcriptional regulator with AAA-type ATPase domain